MNIKDIARLAGVSTATVSRVINNTAYVSPDVKENIFRILEETGYRPNSLAKELLKNKTNLIGVILPRIDLGTFATIVEGINNALNEHGYNILLVNTGERIEDEIKYFKLFQEKRMDGVLYFATGITEKHKEILSKLTFPVVLVGQKNDELNFPSVTYDNYNAAKEMVKHLISLGHRRIACIGVSDYDVEIGKRRKEGYYAALAESGIPVDNNLISIGDFEYESGYNGMKNIMKKNIEKPTAVYGITDRLAIGAMHYLIESGYNIPEDISIAGIDDLEILSYYNPSLTTMGFNYYNAGVSAAELIVSCIEKREIENMHIVLDYEMKLRKSTRIL